MSDLISRQAVFDALIEKGQNSKRYKLGENWELNLPEIIEAINAIPSAESEQKWIPCSERLPEDEYVLISKIPSKISGSKWSVDIAIRTEDPRSGRIQWRDSGFGVIQDDKVLAWMPLPEPYRGDR